MRDLALSKLNLSLNVLGKVGAFHNIDSVVVSVNVHDVVYVRKSLFNKVTVSGCNGIPKQQNIAYRAACAFARHFGVGGCHIRIRKKIPIGAGMGGSSADAASVIRCLCKLYNVDVGSVGVHKVCAELGSDINFLLFGGLARITGKGDTMHFAKMKNVMHFIVTTFSQPMSTAEVYKAYDALPQDNIRPQCNNDYIMEKLQKGQDADAIAVFGNQLQSAVTAMSSYASDYINFCEKHNLPCHMTGSGSAYFVPFVNREEALQALKLFNQNGFMSILCHSVDDSE